MAQLGRRLRRSDPIEARHWLELAAAAGNRSAMGNLGTVFYDQGDVVSARRWLERAAEAGSTGSMVSLATVLRSDAPGEARRWLERAATAGDVRAMGRLGALLTADDPAAARYWLERAAAAGDTGAMVNLGIVLADDAPGEARDWFERAAAAGDARGMSRLGHLLADDDPVVARQWSERAAAAGDILAMLDLSLADLQTDPVRSRRWLEKVAAAGNTKAMIALGGLALGTTRPSRAGRGRDPTAPGEKERRGRSLGWLQKGSGARTAEYWFRKASEHGDVDATVRLAKLLRFRRPRESARLFDRAADAGHRQAMAVVGWRRVRRDLLRNRPISPSRRHAIGLFTPAAEAGSVAAMAVMGGLHLAAKELDEAERWLIPAATQGSRPARFLLTYHQLSDPRRAIRILNTAGTRRPWPAILRFAARLQQRRRSSNP